MIVVAGTRNGLIRRVLSRPRILVFLLAGTTFLGIVFALYRAMDSARNAARASTVL